MNMSVSAVSPGEFSCSLIAIIYLECMFQKLRSTIVGVVASDKTSREAFYPEKAVHISVNRLIISFPYFASKCNTILKSFDRI